MKSCVIDASVLIKLYIEEKHSSAALRQVKAARQWIAPDLLWAEVGNVLWKYVRRDALTPAQADELLQDMLRMPIHVVPVSQVVEAAMIFAVQTDRTVYDCVYLATAIQSRSVMLTADQKLANALAGSDFEKHVRWIGQPG